MKLSLITSILKLQSLLFTNKYSDDYYTQKLITNSEYYLKDVPIENRSFRVSYSAITNNFDARNYLFIPEKYKEEIDDLLLIELGFNKTIDLEKHALQCYKNTLKYAISSKNENNLFVAKKYVLYGIIFYLQITNDNLYVFSKEDILLDWYKKIVHDILIVIISNDD